MEKFLFFLFFDIQQTPRYSTLPDMKDSLYALGYFCETILRSEKLEFTRLEFGQRIQEYCTNQMMQIDIEVLFDGLLGANLLTESGLFYRFRFVQWIYFFAAHRMLHDREFYEFIMKDIQYSRFPELIEFYSGIDRRRNELIDTLVYDLTRLNEEFENRTNVEISFDPYQILSWQPKNDSVQNLRDFIDEAAQQTELPTEMKDLIADENYDSSKPYVQVVREFFDESSLRMCIRVMKVAALVLRNSDHANASQRIRLVDQVMITWSRILQVSVFLSPVLAKDRIGSFEGFGIHLGKSFNETSGDDLWLRILTSLPENITSWFARDIFSHKMWPLFSHFLNDDPSKIEAYLMCSMFVREKPVGWQTEVSKYIASLDKNSFYLSSMLHEMRRSYDVDFSSTQDRKHLREFIGTIIARHETKVTKPNKALIERAAKASLDEHD